MSRYKVDICGVNTANLKTLPHEKQIELFKKYAKGDNSAKEELINGNLKLVLSLLKPYNNRTENMDDLFQVGCIGLIKAIDNFDLKHNVKFSTYAVPMILGEIKRYIRDNNSLRISRSIKDMAYKILKEKEKLTNDKEPSIIELSEALNVSEFEIAQALNSMKDTLSMSEPIYNDGSDVIYLEDQLSAPKETYDQETKIALKNALNKIRDREKYIITQRYIIGKTQMELADEIGISQAQISRLEKSGLDSIKKLMK